MSGAEIYDERADVGGHGVPEILVKGGRREGDEAASALNSTANVGISRVRSWVSLCVGETCVAVKT